MPASFDLTLRQNCIKNPVLGITCANPMLFQMSLKTVQKKKFYITHVQKGHSTSLGSEASGMTNTVEYHVCVGGGIKKPLSVMVFAFTMLSQFFLIWGYKCA